MATFLAGCDDPLLSPFTGWGYIRDWDRQPTSVNTLVFSGDSGIAQIDGETGQWSRSGLTGVVEITPVPENDFQVIFPSDQVVNSENRRADFTVIDLSDKSTAITAHRNFVTSLTIGYPHPLGTYSFFSEKVNKDYATPFLSSASTVKLDHERISLARSASNLTSYQAVSFGNGAYTIVRPRRSGTFLGLDAHAVLMNEDGAWNILIPGMFFLGEHSIAITVRNSVEWLSNWIDVGENLEGWVQDILFIEYIDRVFRKTVGEKADEGFLVEKTRYRYRSHEWDGKALTIEVNEDLVNVENAYRGRLTLGSTNTFIRNAARHIKNFFLLDENVAEVNLRIFVPVYTDDYGTIANKEVGKIRMTREVYEKIQWDTIRTEMVVEHLQSDWWY